MSKPAYWLRNYLNILYIMLLVRLTKLPFYLALSVGLWLIGVLFFPPDQPFGFWQCIGIVLALRILSASVRPMVKAADLSDARFYKEPYQVPIEDLAPGICWYADTLLYFNGDYFYDVYTSQIFKHRRYMKFYPSTGPAHKLIHDVKIEPKPA